MLASIEPQLFNHSFNNMKNLIFTIFLCVLSTGVFSQSLTNTSWELFFPDSTKGYVNFGTDTLSRSSDSIAFTALSIFQENMDSLIINDIFPDTTTCGTSGKYTFVITNDTLDFTLVSDTCSIRRFNFIGGIWVKILATEIEDIETEPSLIKVYPNPVKNTLFIESAINYRNSPFTISNHLGQQILSGQLTNEVHSISTSEIPTGLYYIQIGKEKRQAIMIIKQ